MAPPKRFRLIHSTDNFYDPYLHVHGLIIFCLFLAHKGKANTEGHKIYFRLICLLLPNLLLKVKSLELIYWLKRHSLVFVSQLWPKKSLEFWVWRNRHVKMNNLGFYTTKIWPLRKLEDFFDVISPREEI